MNYEIIHKDIECVTKCLICSAMEFENISEVYVEDLNFLSTVCCTKCGFVFRGKRPRLKWFEKNWAIRDKYRTENKISLDDRVENNRYIRYKNLASAFEKLIEGRKIIDIGTGPGMWLKAFLDKGWDVTGIEPDPFRAKVGKEKHGLNVIVMTIEQYKNNSESYDLATIIHVLEHFHSPVEILANIEVPDIKKFVSWKDSLYMEHMNNFSEDSLLFLAGRVGLIPKYRFSPKTQPYGVVRPGILFQRRENWQSQGGMDYSYKKCDSPQKIKQLYRRGLLFDKKDTLRFCVSAIEDLCMTLKKLDYPYCYKAGGRFLWGSRRTITKLFSQFMSILSTYNYSEIFKKVLQKFAKTYFKDKSFYSLKYKFYYCNNGSGGLPMTNYD